MRTDLGIVVALIIGGATLYKVWEWVAKMAWGNYGMIQTFTGLAL